MSQKRGFRPVSRVWSVIMDRRGTSVPTVLKDLRNVTKIEDKRRSLECPMSRNFKY